jgi:hypothetical protein
LQGELAGYAGRVAVEHGPGLRVLGFAVGDVEQAAGLGAVGEPLRERGEAELGGAGAERHDVDVGAGGAEEGDVPGLQHVADGVGGGVGADRVEVGDLHPDAGGDACGAGEAADAGHGPQERLDVDACGSLRIISLNSSHVQTMGAKGSSATKKLRPFSVNPSSSSHCSFICSAYRYSLTALAACPMSMAP